MIWRQRNKSSIIHQINKENKKAYRERIIERNRKAKELQAKQDELNVKNEALKNNETPKKGKGKTKPIKDKVNVKPKNDDFDDIMNADNNPSRVKDYSKEAKVVSKNAPNPASVEVIKLEESKNGTLPTIKENSKEQNNEKSFNEKNGKDKYSDSFQNRDLSDDSSSSEESDINDRAEWKINSVNKKPDLTANKEDIEYKPEFKPGNTNSHIKKMGKDDPSEAEEESDNA